MEGYQFDKLRAFSEDKNHHVNLSEKEIEKFAILCKELIEQNRQVNLTAIDEPLEIERKHFIDSLTAVDIIKKHSDGEYFSLIDIGCGAGFPGIPLKIAFPNADFVLVDSVSKKISFVRDMIEKLDLIKIEAESERIEILARSQYRESFDFCTARAVSSLPVLLEYSLPFLKNDGRCIFYKGGQCDEEISSAQHALEVLGGEIESVDKFTLPFSTEERSLIVVRKTKDMPEKYPRKNGKPEKSPL